MADAQNCDYVLKHGLITYLQSSMDVQLTGTLRSILYYITHEDLQQFKTDGVSPVEVLRLVHAQFRLNYTFPTSSESFKQCLESTLQAMTSPLLYWIHDLAIRVLFSEYSLTEDMTTETVQILCNALLTRPLLSPYIQELLQIVPLHFHCHILRSLLEPTVDTAPLPHELVLPLIHEVMITSFALCTDLDTKESVFTHLFTQMMEAKGVLYKESERERSRAVLMANLVVFRRLNAKEVLTLADNSMVKLGEGLLPLLFDPNVYSATSNADLWTFCLDTLEEMISSTHSWKTSLAREIATKLQGFAQEFQSLPITLRQRLELALPFPLPKLDIQLTAPLRLCYPANQLQGALQIEDYQDMPIFKAIQTRVIDRQPSFVDSAVSAKNSQRKKRPLDESSFIPNRQPPNPMQVINNAMTH